jgi:hypothetical protein
MGKVVKIVFKHIVIESKILELKSLHDRAVNCSAMKFYMSQSRGDAKDALLDAHEAMATFAGTVATMLSDMIEDLNYAKEKMREADLSVAKSMISTGLDKMKGNK